MACVQSELQFFEGELDRADVRALLQHHFAQMRADSPPEACHVLPIRGLRGPEIHFISVRDSNRRLLGIGALKTVERGHGEVKSMRTHPEALGAGVGKAMLERLIELAQSQGMKRLSLETGNSPLFTAANRLYERSGFVRCGPFGGYSDTPFTNFYTRDI